MAYRGVIDDFFRAIAREQPLRVPKVGLWSFYHASEEKEGHLKLQASSGVSVLSVGPGLDMSRAKAVVGDEVCLIGNLDPVDILMKGTVDQVASETRRIMSVGTEGNGYIFNTGEMVPRDTPVENMDTMMRTAGSLACLASGCTLPQGCRPTPWGAGT